MSRRARAQPACILNRYRPRDWEALPWSQAPFVCPAPPPFVMCLLWPPLGAREGKRNTVSLNEAALEPGSRAVKGLTRCGEGV